MPLSYCTLVQLKEAVQGVLLAKLCVMVMMTAKLILLRSSLPFLHWPTFCMQNVCRIRYISAADLPKQQIYVRNENA